MIGSVPRILIVDDDRSIRRTLEKFLVGEGYDVATAQDAPGAITALDRSPELVLLDLGLPGGSGFDVLSALSARVRPPTVVVVTARDDMQSTVKAIQLGAYEYLVKPVDIDRLREVISRALVSREAHSALVALPDGDDHARGDILGKSPAIRDVWKQIGAVSTTRAPVLITGESGTGKELVARAIHVASADREQPFVAVNCSALAPGVLESELFGHEKGARSPAPWRDRPGRFELAGRRHAVPRRDAVTSPVEVQVKLLRVLQERDVRARGRCTETVHARRARHLGHAPRSVEDGHRAGASSARICTTASTSGRDHAAAAPRSHRAIVVAPRRALASPSSIACSGKNDARLRHAKRARVP